MHCSLLKERMADFLFTFAANLLLTDKQNNKS